MDTEGELVALLSHGGESKKWTSCPCRGLPEKKILSNKNTNEFT
jgi:hypothetical protein